MQLKGEESEKEITKNCKEVKIRVLNNFDIKKFDVSHGKSEDENKIKKTK